MKDNMYLLRLFLAEKHIDATIEYNMGGTFHHSVRVRHSGSEYIFTICKSACTINGAAGKVLKTLKALL